MVATVGWREAPPKRGVAAAGACGEPPSNPARSAMEALSLSSISLELLSVDRERSRMGSSVDGRLGGAWVRGGRAGQGEGGVW